MKQTKIFIMMLAALLMGGCSDDDDDTTPDTPDTPDTPELIDFADYSTLIGASYSSVIRQYPNPVMNFGDFYMYEPNDGKVEAFTVAINPTTQTVYMVIQTLASNAYSEADIDAYFAAKFTSYGKEAVADYDEDGKETGTYTNYYSYGNNAKPEEATLQITLMGNTGVTYLNPFDVPEEQATSFEEITPIEAVLTFMGADIEDVLDEYGDALLDAGGIYMAFMEENPLLMGFALYPVDGIVTSMALLYNEELTDDDIIAYYEEAGYTIQSTGTNEDGLATYQFADDDLGIVIAYCDLVGTVTLAQ